MTAIQDFTPVRSATEPQRVAAVGWQADIYLDQIELTVSPEGDLLPSALERLFSIHQRRYWMVTWDREDAHGRDVYLLERVNPSLC